MPPLFKKKNCLVNRSLSLAVQKAAIYCFSFPCISYAINWGTHAQQTVFFLNQTFAKCIFKKTQTLPRSQTCSNLSLIFKLFFFLWLFIYFFSFSFSFLSSYLCRASDSENRFSSKTVWFITIETRDAVWYGMIIKVKNGIISKG